MTPRWALAAVTAVLAVLPGQSAAAANPADEAPVQAVAVTLDRSQHSVAVGDRFTVRTRLVNRRAVATDRLVAHLNIASLTGDGHVDPEDWSARRTVVLPALTPGADTELRWEIQAVDSGRFGVYVVVLPGIGGGTVAASPVAHVHVSGRRTLTAGGVLPVVLVVPLLLGGLLALTRLGQGHSR